MNFLLRFGRRLAVPSSAGIRAEYKQFAAKEELRTRWAHEEGLPAHAGWDEIIACRAERFACRQAKSDSLSPIAAGDTRKKRATL